MNDNSAHLLTLGWREWVGLPDLGINRIKAKIDTGARTSVIHAFEVSPFMEDGMQRVRFLIHPRQRDDSKVVECIADATDQRVITDSGGHKEMRWVIETRLLIDDESWPLEMTLTSRDDMQFRMLLGRTAMAGRATVDPAMSYLQGKRRRSRA